MANRSGLCGCGCGQKAPIAGRTERARGRVKGQPMRFIHGHNGYLARAFVFRVDAETGCWVWQGATMPGGYGHLQRNGKPYTAHRWSYEQAKGPIPEGLELDHLCRNRRCVNPDHLEPVTRAENVRRSYAARQGAVA